MGVQVGEHWARAQAVHDTDQISTRPELRKDRGRTHDVMDLEFDALAAIIVSSHLHLNTLSSLEHTLWNFHQTSLHHTRRTTQNGQELREITRTLPGTATAGKRDGERAGSVMSARWEGAR